MNPNPLPMLSSPILISFAKRSYAWWTQSPHRSALCALSLFPLLFFVKARMQGAMLFGSDTLLIFAPLRALGFEHLRSGNLLEWNPYVVAGMPYLGEIQTTLLYPLHLPFLFLPLPLAITFTLLVHLWLSGIFMYWWARRLNVSLTGAVVAGLTYQLSGFQLAHLYAGHHTITTTYAWLPLMFLGAQRAIEERSWLWTVIVGVALCLQILAGYPGITYYTCLGLAIWWTALSLRQAAAETNAQPSTWGTAQRPFPTRLLGFFALGVCAALIALALSAFQILPTLETSTNSMREGGTSYTFASSFSLPPENLICFLFPDFFGDAVRLPYWGRWYGWELSGYVGVLPLLLIVVALATQPSFHVRLLGVLAGLALLLTLGRYLFFYPWIYRLLPGLAFFRGPSRALVLWTLAASILVGFGWDRLLSSEDNATRRLRFLARSFCALAGIGIVGLLLFAKAGSGSNFWEAAVSYFMNLGTPDERFTQITLPYPIFLWAFFDVSQQSLCWGVLLLTYAAVWTWQRLRPSDEETAPSSSKASRGWMLAGLLLIGIDLLAYGNKYVKGVPLSRAQFDPDVVRFLRRRRTQEGPVRVVNLTRQYSDNAGAMHGIEMVGGFDPFIPQRFIEFTNFSEGRPLNVPLVVAKPSRHTPLLDLLNARYFMTERNAPLKDKSLTEVFQNQKVRIYENRRALPRAWIVHDVRIITDKVALLKTLAHKEFDPRRTALLEQPIHEGTQRATRNAQHATRNTQETCRIVGHAPEQVTIEAQLASDGYVILADAFFPGWEARVDGKRVNVLRANYLFRAVRVPSGEHTITFTYRSRGLHHGGYVSAGAWLLLLIAALFFVRRLVFPSPSSDGVARPRISA